ncbi:hypothetical protein BB558_007264 [Smittium angustum]|uniref:Uncharacterized protein n=1 Tax=Smittium angustum TaxID=133377 RepID=A0A2U1IVG3_SMIAN|nr:hypothetical protein BB558_007264 [Smittium angustum]
MKINNIDSLQLNKEYIEILAGEKLLVIWSFKARTTKRKPADQIWELFTEKLEAYKLSNENHAPCKNCKEVVRRHNKVLSVQTHLRKCPGFIKLMKNTQVSNRPEWFQNKKTTVV